MRIELNLPSGPVPRVAFFTDSFHEVNGVALTSRQFAQHARAHFYPFLSVHAGEKTQHWKRGTFETYELAASRAVLRLENDLVFDLAFLRHRRKLLEATAAFRPDVIHVTGPSHLGFLGAMIAHELGVPLVASWHTNVHEYGARRLAKLLGRVPGAERLARSSENLILGWACRFYQLAQLAFAPNAELVALLQERTGRPVHLMQRGIDTQLFTPARRRESTDRFTLGYVGRLSAEKNVRLLRSIGKELERMGKANFRFLICGEGSEKGWLREHIPQAEFTGILKGEALAGAYASMDAFVFPSETDTFGNVILEAHAAGVPALVTRKGGPRHLVESGQTGFLADTAEEFAQAACRLMDEPELLESMRQASRASVLNRSWDAVFDSVYVQYKEALKGGVIRPKAWPEARRRGARLHPAMKHS